MLNYVVREPATPGLSIPALCTKYPLSPYPGPRLPSGMAKIRVFQFDYFDRREGRVVRAEDFATPRAIAEIGAVAVEETALDVDEGRVGFAGYLIREKERS